MSNPSDLTHLRSVVSAVKRRQRRVYRYVCRSWILHPATGDTAFLVCVTKNEFPGSHRRSNGAAADELAGTLNQSLWSPVCDLGKGDMSNHRCQAAMLHTIQQSSAWLFALDLPPYDGGNIIPLRLSSFLPRPCSRFVCYLFSDSLLRPLKKDLFLQLILNFQTVVTDGIVVTSRSI